MQIFFAFHDPTTPDQQGPDTGTQYRSAIFRHDATQERTAREVIAEREWEKVFDAPIVTQLAPLDEFFPAEASHQEYYRRNPSQPYCRAWIAPKIAKLRSKYSARLKASAL
ncbi:MAG: peptide-methionine (S)-S-oxide reductase [Gemmatimonadales bacterium]